MSRLKYKLSLFACILICTVYIGHRIYYSTYNRDAKTIVTDWDALGYYLYLPATIIYQDYKQLAWFPAIDSQYHVSGGTFYQALKHENGNYYIKYLSGVALLQLPYFLTAHIYASNTSHYMADGFSPPYQQAIAWGNVIYFILALFLLRRLLLQYFSDKVTMISLLAMTLGTNLIQYVTVDSGMSHGYIFPLYVWVLWATYQWHRQPRWTWAALIGGIIGLATISRPTEAVMLFIPLLWDTHTRASAKRKWQLVAAHLPQVCIAIMGGMLAILPQLLYWKSVTGSFIYDVGSKWSFLNPFFRVLIGWEKGWFIYTPITIFFIVGLFFLKKYAFKNAVLWFGILNIYIIISWFDWRYGGSYSTRALSQSYPVYCLSMAAYINIWERKRFRWLGYALGVYLIGVNIFQVWQYNRQILHYNDMNRAYYNAIYLDPSPSPLDMSLLDTDEYLHHPSQYKTEQWKDILPINTQLQTAPGAEFVLLDTSFSDTNIQWLKVNLQLLTFSGSWQGTITTHWGEHSHSFRLQNALTKEQQENSYSFYLQRPASTGELKIGLQSPSGLQAQLKSFSIVSIKKKHE